LLQLQAWGRSADHRALCAPAPPDRGADLQPGRCPRWSCARMVHAKPCPRHAQDTRLGRPGAWGFCPQLGSQPARRACRSSSPPSSSSSAWGQDHPRRRSADGPH